MIFPSQLVEGKLIKRYKRFLSEIQLHDNSIVLAHCTNSGSMKTCIEANAPVMISHNDNPNRKTQYTWEMIFINNNWIGINTLIPNQLVYEFIINSQIKGLDNFDFVNREVKYGNSRIDIYAQNDKEKCYIEVKNVTMKDGCFASFPDAKTTRGLKHLKELIDIKKNGMRAVMVYVIQRMDITKFTSAKEIDPEYADMLKIAFEKGVEIFPIQVKVSPSRIDFYKILDFEL